MPVVRAALALGAIHTVSAFQRASYSEDAWEYEDDYYPVSPKWTPVPLVNENWKDPDTGIHFNIAHFRDGERCFNTLFQGLLLARYPRRVHWHVYEQLGQGDPSCKTLFETHAHRLCDERAAIKHRRIPSRFSQGTVDPDEHAPCDANVFLQNAHFAYADASKSSGPVSARAKGQRLQFGAKSVHELHRGQASDIPHAHDFCVNLDAHMVFVENWDMIALTDFAEANNERAVFTSYPNDAGDAIFLNPFQDHEGEITTRTCDVHFLLNS